MNHICFIGPYPPPYGGMAIQLQTMAENLRKDVDVIIGRPEIDSWGIIFTPEGARLRKVPVEFDIIWEFS